MIDSEDYSEQNFVFFLSSYTLVLLDRFHSQPLTDTMASRATPSPQGTEFLVAHTGGWCDDSAHVSEVYPLAPPYLLPKSGQRN